jgi:nucleoside-diphosphate-sugar epimerase
VTRLVAITGATGFIGWHVACRFLERGWRVQALVRPESRRAVPAGADRVTTPLREDAVTAACGNAHLFIHLAAAIKAQSAAEFRQANVDTTAELALAARAIGVRFVHLSSLGVTGPGNPAHPPSEDDPPRPINAYGESKHQSELAVRRVAGLEWTILRPALVYGPRDRQFFPIFRLAKHGLFPVPNRSAVYNLIHVDDVARGVETAALGDEARSQVFFLGHPTPVTGIEVLAQMATVFGRRFRPLRVPRVVLRAAAAAGSLASRAGWPISLDRERLREMEAEGFVCRTNKARDQLGFTAEVPLLDGFRRTAAWYASQGWL